MNHTISGCVCVFSLSFHSNTVFLKSEKNMAIVLSRRLKCAIATIGIFVSFFIFGYLQEEITRGKYVDENGEDEKFSFS